MDCLDQHADNWRTVSLQLTMDEPMPVKVEKVAPMMQQHQGPRSIESTPSTKVSKSFCPLGEQLTEEYFAQMFAFMSVVIFG